MLEVFYAAGLRSLGPVESAQRFRRRRPFLFPHSPDTGPGLTDAGKALVRACNELGILVDLSHMNEKGFWDVAQLSTSPLVASHSNAHALTPTPRNLTDRQLDAIRDSGGVVGVNFAIGFWATVATIPRRPSRASSSTSATWSSGWASTTSVLARTWTARACRTKWAMSPGLPRVVDGLRWAGFDDADVQKLTHANWLRVLGQTWTAN